MQKSTITPESLFPVQREILAKGFLDSQCNWIIATPTGTGKTLLAELAIMQCMQKKSKAAYLAPMKSIVEERMISWQQLFASWQIGLFTGDNKDLARKILPEQTDILLLTPEKLDSYVTFWKRNLLWVAKIDLLVIDELHLLADKKRGARLEALITRLLRVNPFVRIIGLSATVANLDEITCWLHAEIFQSEWRPVPIKQKIITYKKNQEKNEILLNEIKATLKNQGKVLVFVNSRRRAERLMEIVAQVTSKVSFHHAGTARVDRLTAEDNFRGKGIDVLVATSTLEMGVNLPAHKVIIYDSYVFDGENFSPLSVLSFVQRCGRAGRPGLGKEGQAVLLWPSWAESAKPYRNVILEPVRSHLFDQNAREREILYEVCSRLSISRRHLETNFASHTLWRKQGGKRNLEEELTFLLETGLLKEVEKEKNTYLVETSLGKIASQMYLAPSTIVLFAKIFHLLDSPRQFDLLFLLSLVHECSAKMFFNFEEIDTIGDLIIAEKSAVLDGDISFVREFCSSITEKAILSAVKNAAAMTLHIAGNAPEQIAKSLDCYPNDLSLLRQNLCWILSAAQRCFAVLRLRENPESKDPGSHEQAVKRLIACLEYGIPAHCLSLVSIPGVGAIKAQTLIKAGIESLEQLAQIDKKFIENLPGFGAKTATGILEYLRDLQEVPFDFELEDLSHETFTPKQKFALDYRWPIDIDPYRLRRALELDIEQRSLETMMICGGSEPHLVSVEYQISGQKKYICDCADYCNGTKWCKHILRTRLELHDDREIIEALQYLQNIENKPLRWALGDLWMKICGVYDVFNGRKVDYTGKKFMQKAYSAKRWDR